MKEDLPSLRMELQQVRTDLASVRTELASLRAEVIRCREEFVSLRLSLCAPPQQQFLPLLPSHPPAPASTQLVTLDQLAAMVGLSKRTLEKYRQQMPPPRRVGVKGRSSLWAWADVRVWLQETFHRRLPEEFPGLAG